MSGAGIPLGTKTVSQASDPVWPSDIKRPAAGLAATPDGRGYWVVAADGGILSLGDAAFLGSDGI